jgi:flagellar basal-body rod modification protein FlgD
VNAHRSLLAVQNGDTYASNPAFPGKTFPQPNPFRPLDGAPVQIIVPAAISDATDKKIILMNIAGEEVKTINCPGECEWDGKNDAGTYVASGLYYYRVESSLGNVDGKITVIK